jgi:ketosteroid isomerase-like protein
MQPTPDPHGVVDDPKHDHKAKSFRDEAPNPHNSVDDDPNHEDKAKDFKGQEPDVLHDGDDDAEGEHKAKEFAMRHGEELRRRLNDTM